MLLVVRTIIWSSNFFLLRGYPDMCNLLDGLVALQPVGRPCGTRRLVCICFPTPGRGLPYRSGLGLSRCLGPGECLHSFKYGDVAINKRKKKTDHRTHESAKQYQDSTSCTTGMCSGFELQCRNPRSIENNIMRGGRIQMFKLKSHGQNVNKYIYLALPHIGVAVPCTLCA